MIEKFKNLKRREQVILVVMVVAVLYGAVTFIMTRMGDAGRQGDKIRQIESADISAITKNVNAVLRDEVSAASDAYVIARAEVEWKNDPFYTGASLLSPDRKIEFRYTGYVEYAGRKVAVVNGVDYQTGDELEMGGFIVKRISPSEVVIKDKGSLGEITIPFQEEE